MSIIKGIIMGVDPSLRSTGIAVADTRQLPWRLVVSLTIRRHPDASFAAHMAELCGAIGNIMQRAKPTHAAIESAVWVQNHDTALTLAKVEGACIAAMATMGICPAEYAPRVVKHVVCGNAAASKSTIAAAVSATLNLSAPLMFDESDAAAVAICHARIWAD
jgi:crossover junction endodeoxyribonuclease RuvC